MPKNRKNKYAGFSFMEVILSVAVLSIGIMGVMPLIVSGLRETLDSRDQVIAAMLAQEGAELTQNFRDNNWANGEKAFKKVFPSVDKDNCRVSYDDSDDMICKDSGNGSSKTLNLNGDSFYTHSAGIATKFQRKMEIVYDTGVANTAKQAIITSVVVWSGSSGVFPDQLSDCNTTNKCAYNKVVLTIWYDD